MYNSIQHFNGFGTRKIEETIKNFISQKKDIADLVLGLQESLYGGFVMTTIYFCAIYLILIILIKRNGNFI